MKELRNEAVRNEYIGNKCEQLIGAKPQSIEFIDEGAMNFVYKAVTPKGIIYFKQALKQAKDAHRIGKDLASIPYKRIQYEKNVIDSVHSALPPEINMPEIMDYDEENNVLVMGDVAGYKSVLLQDALLAGDFNPQVAANVGKFLGISHKCTYNKDIIIRGNHEEDRRNWEIFLNMRTKGIKSSEEVNKELSDLFDDTLNNHTYDVLINMDCCPKNIFQRKDNSIGTLDFELASGCGDPSYDLGFALGHYMLFAALKEVNEESERAMQAMVESYEKEFDISKFDGFIKRMIKYAGAVLLYRVAGSSPAKFIPKEKYDELIEKGSKIITSDFTELKPAVDLLK